MLSSTPEGRQPPPAEVGTAPVDDGFDFMLVPSRDFGLDMWNVAGVRLRVPSKGAAGSCLLHYEGVKVLCSGRLDASPYDGENGS